MDKIVPAHGDVYAKKYASLVNTKMIGLGRLLQKTMVPRRAKIVHLANFKIEWVRIRAKPV